MCGFVGGNMFQSREQLIDALNKISHRGKDFTGQFQHKNLFLGHNRLSIQDLSSSSNQPFINDFEDIILLYSGELWQGFERLKAEHLSKKNFRTSSDTEVILRLYEKYGTSCFAILDGMFSIAIFDKMKNSIILARDWIGKIPLYYFIDSNGKIVFGNEIKSFSNLSTELQSLEQVKVIEPGKYFVYDLDNHSSYSEKFYSLPYSKEYGGNYDLKDTPDVIAKNIREKLENAVQKRLISDVPVCVLLSGGIDSVITSYLAKKYMPNIEAFTVSIGDTGKKDDLFYARKAAKEIGVKLNEVILDEATFLNELDNTIFAIEDSKWTQLSTAIVQIPLAREIGKRGFKVAIGGEGSDEVFASYADIEAFHYKPEAYHKQRKKLIDTIHLTNLRRTNCAMLWGGTVEMRSPFLDKDFVEYAINIPAHYAWRFRDFDSKRTKPLLREAFKGEISDELLYRKKVPTGVGAHSQDSIKAIFERDKDYFKRRLKQLLF